ncbi:transposon ty3-g Gag-Pol polyprotein [Plakobranchus ocellatus]|uniref:Transposon ty3-g Gag-Pol polyprotein n=1 Tax=Plakobranchus ocellatus TaxID=259542 RepID=A0AAV3Y8W8_9GAST|nr:transposon ty3-g Gag-Pol polyprotein [Plakobranchus ocellatus]
MLNTDIGRSTLMRRIVFLGGLVFNKSKYHIKQAKIHFYGLVWDAEGAQSRPKQVSLHISTKPSTTNVAEQFLGLVQFMSPLVPQLSDNTSLLRNLLQKDAQWQWTPTHEAAFKKLKCVIHEYLTLRYFNPNDPAAASM